MLSELHVQVRDIVGRACENTLAQHGFVPDPMEDPDEGMNWPRPKSLCQQAAQLSVECVPACWHRLARLIG